MGNIRVICQILAKTKVGIFAKTEKAFFLLIFFIAFCADYKTDDPLSLVLTLSQTIPSV